MLKTFVLDGVGSQSRPAVMSMDTARYERLIAEPLRKLHAYKEEKMDEKMIEEVVEAVASLKDATRDGHNVGAAAFNVAMAALAILRKELGDPRK